MRDILRAFIVCAVLLQAANVCGADMKTADKTGGVAVLDGMRHVKTITVERGLQAESYCTDSSTSAVFNAYRKLYKTAMDVEEGSASGVKKRLLLDIDAPDKRMKWMSSKKFIEIYKGSGIKKGCPTVVNIIAPPAKTAKPPASVKPSAPEVRPAAAGRKVIGIGLHADTLNLSAGPTVIVWPFQSLALQMSYGAGAFTSYQARMLYRYTTQSKLNPYFGVGFIHADKTVEAIGAAAKAKGDSASLFGGLERPLYNWLAAYVEVGATPLKVENNNVTNGSRSAKVSVAYSPVTIGIGLIVYPF
ncbi:MAG: hypothetical protein HY886_10015 [Deltaproteobacteria bacterium]|nr:hypothetical protein [Deltaproteobacteria bacterium]